MVEKTRDELYRQYEADVELNTKNEQDYSTETLWHNDKIISTAVMQEEKLIAFEFNPENI